jgi:hypothetical protein
MSEKLSNARVSQKKEMGMGGYAFVHFLKIAPGT